MATDLSNSSISGPPAVSQFACKVIHIAMTPLAGSPIRIVRALNAYTNVAARLLTVNEYPSATGLSFPTDLCWWIKDDRATFFQALESADVIHLHHWMVLENNQLGINFSQYLGRGKKIIRQFHSNPNFVAHHARMTAASILRDALPQLTLPQLHERFYPRARIVPNIVPIEDPPYTDPHPPAETGLSVYYRPSSYGSAWSDRWETKGAPEVMAALNWTAKNIPGIRIDAELRGIPHEEHLRRRAACSVGIDDVVTGSFHLNSLETFAQGRAVVCYLDARQIVALTRFAGCNELPFINFSVEDLPMVLSMLSQNLPLVQELGQQGRQWMERYWHPKKMVEHYVAVYRDLLIDGTESFSVPRFDADNLAVRWMTCGAEDMKWLIRRNHMAGKSS